jgi:two-component system CheB/CheR fusion protein
VQGDGYLIGKEIRQMILFAQHDVILDPPFTRLDILSCRNLMIYFNAALQQRLLPLFHYVIASRRCVGAGRIRDGRPIGALFVPAGSEVAAVPARRRPQRHCKRGFSRQSQPVIAREPTQESNVSHPLNRLSNLQSLADQVLLQEFSPAAVLVNEQGDVVYISGHTGKYLEPAAGKANWNIHVMARPAIRTHLAAAMRQALQEKKTVEVHDLKPEEDARLTLDLTVQPLREPTTLEGLILIVFRDVAIPPAAKRSEDAQPAPPIRRTANLWRARTRKFARCARKCMPLRKSCRARTRNCSRPTKSCSRPTRS